MLPRALDRSLLLLEGLNASSLPSQVKPTRLSLLRARELVDLFIFAYDPACEDLISSIRHELDEGYELMGLFQDLDHAHVEYKHKDLMRYLGLCLAWKSSFVSHANTQGYHKYLLHPSLDSLFPRDHISPLFWGCCNAQARPSLDLDGMGNFACLASAMAEDDVERTGSLLSIEADAVVSKSNHLMLHSYRKSLRSLSSLLAIFPDLIRTSRIVPYLDQAFHSLGKVTDGIFAYDFYRKRGEGKKAKAAREGTIETWRSVKAQLIVNDLGKRLSDFSVEVLGSNEALNVSADSKMI